MVGGKRKEMIGAAASFTWLVIQLCLSESKKIKGQKFESMFNIYSVCTKIRCCLDTIHGMKYLPV